ncbi:uncharacterized protein LOC135691596 isoform X1 [Rhopilema esculentum]|uniref:uncharacterized protein LOC135691596 isoform X1 n=1 Tax=Rhopilema esculentum TaxID=499914 RepID=UPI0031D96C7D|eukprot:gene9177-16846_t
MEKVEAEFPDPMEVVHLDSDELPKFPQSLTDADYLLKLNTKPSVLPSFGGEKESVVSDEFPDKTTNFYQELADVLSEERVCRKGSLSTGRWDPSRGLVIVDNAVGTFWQKFGTKLGSLLYALPEEALFLIEQGVFELFSNKLPLTVQEAWALLLTHVPSSEYYNTFAFLCRQGFAVISSRKYRYFYACNQSHFGIISPRDIDCRTSSDSTLKEGHISAPSVVIDEPSYENSGRDSCVQIGEPFIKSNAIVANEELCVGQVHEGIVDMVKEEGEENSTGVLKDSEVKQQEEIETEADCLETSSKLQSLSPLVQPTDAVSVEAILAKLQIIKPRVSGGRRSYAIKDTEIGEEISAAYEVKQLPYLDVYYKSSGFKKSSPGLPDCRVFVCNYTDLPPSQLELKQMHAAANGTPVKFAVSSYGSVTFYGMVNVNVSASSGLHSK